MMTKTPCVYCGYVFDESSEVTGSSAKPEQGDPTLCIKCGRVLVFGDDLLPRRPSQTELTGLQRDACWPLLERARHLLLAMKDQPANGQDPPPAATD